MNDPYRETLVLTKEHMNLIIMRGLIGLQGVYVDLDFIHVNPATVKRTLEAI